MDRERRFRGFWEWVRPGSGSTCSAALATGDRSIVPDIELSDFLAGSEDLETYRQTGIRAVQSTPLVSRAGPLLGMISTHWRKPHQPSERELRLLDVLARQAADLIERKQTEVADQRLAGIVDSLTIDFDEIPRLGVTCKTCSGVAGRR
jgi:GAF domain-containing protein